MVIGNYYVSLKAPYLLQLYGFKEEKLTAGIQKEKQILKII
jgi:hypothetical protein